jgi:hypothetical protein
MSTRTPAPQFRHTGDTVARMADAEMLPQLGRVVLAVLRISYSFP